MWWCTPAIKTHGRFRHEGQEFKPGLAYIVTPKPILHGVLSQTNKQMDRKNKSNDFDSHPYSFTFSLILKDFPTWYYIVSVAQYNVS